MKKKGQLQLSFSMIFSIILIIATIAIAIYFIVQFLETSRCAQINFFKSDLQNQIDSVWKSAQAQKSFDISLPNKINKVCIGNLSAQKSLSLKEYEELKRYQFTDANLFLLPSFESCGGNLAKSRLAHIEDGSLICFQLEKGKGKLLLNKDSSSQNLVKVAPKTA